MQQNLIEKIAQRSAVDLEEDQLVRSGDYLNVRPSFVMTHDNTGAIIPKFRAIAHSLGNGLKVTDPGQVVFALDHNIQDRSRKTVTKYERIHAFAREMGVDFYPAGRGIGHQIMCEEGYVWPATMVVASDSHSNMYGAFGCLGTPVVRTDAASIWATGVTWWQVPPVARVVIRGRLRSGVSGKDVILTLCGLFCNDEVLNHAIEFTGEGLSSLSMAQRMTIANMTTEWGALAGVFPVDRICLDWFRSRSAHLERRGPFGVASDRQWREHHPRIFEERIAHLETSPLRADRRARYAVELDLDLDRVEPRVAGPDSVKVSAPLSELQARKIDINKAYLVSCVNSRVEDLTQAAEVLRGKKVASGVEFYVAAASSEVQEESERRGDWQTILNSGAISLPPGCGPCIGLGAGLLEDGEVGISATNRNFKGRMGSRNAQVYLASPAVVAASAVAGRIEVPDGMTSPHLGTNGRGAVKPVRRPTRESVTRRVRVIAGFPDRLRGDLLFCHQDNLNTDGIFPGKYTYIDDFTPEQQASVAMENYDPDFGTIARSGDIVVGGFNFGCGSSREQAATALKHAGIRFVIAGSCSETYKRNALNNGFLVVEAPDLVRHLKEVFGTARRTVQTGYRAELDVAASQVSTRDSCGAKHDYPITPIGKAAQELLLRGGLHEWVCERVTGKAHPRSSESR